ncbi:MAG: ATP-dependent DNA helicase RecG [Anaeroplasmataceae bacterium]|nr:ATP-dependent DNA helicase RecG [Anaeroplasmataceae bacterium]MDE6241193.1 ATP-dependent DNA helicase RecG [Anaeroplasmataceae bacterium]
MNLELKDIKHIGPVTLDRLNANHIYTPKDLLLRFPKRYYFYQVDNEHAFCGETLCFKAVVASRPVWIKTVKRSRAFVFYVNVNERKIKCIIFSGDYLRFKLQVGIPIICYGKYKEKENEFSLTTIFFEDFECRIELDYGIPDINNKTIQNAIERVLQTGYSLEDDLPLEYIQKYRLGTINELMRLAHFPKSITDCTRVRRRIRYEDFFWYTASLEALKRLKNSEEKQPKKINIDMINQFIQGLPYELTQDQRHVLNECLNDISSTKIMNRLIQGDVGSGKSIVAFICSLAVISAGYQVALMVPTEILAKQHYENVRKLFPNVAIELLTSSVKLKEKEDILYKLMHGRISLIIGTHALIENQVIFKNLGLAIIDEQHRFGVNQRKALLEKLKGVDALYLTATPIPRTLGLTSFGDLDLSMIKTMPKNRKPVLTKIVPMEQLSSLAKALERHLACDEQIYVVVPLIEESERLDYIDMNQAIEIFEKLLPKAKFGVLHGKMKVKDKDSIMNAFKNHELDCLLSTTVIEVGVDVSNATVMVILDAERYGLSQIHQLRGRVGRGSIQSYCYLVTTKDYVKRLDILEKTTDGFLLAEEDFKLRGPGDYLGEEQSGFNSLNFDYESNDIMIWKCALEDSKEFISKYLLKEVDNSRLDTIFKQISVKKSKIN